jgi:adenylate kinase
MNSYVIDFPKLNNFLELNTTCEDLIILDGHVSHLLNPDCIIVLRLNPERIFDRLSLRNYSEKKIKENVEAEILDVCLVESIENNVESKIFEIDCTEKSVLDICNIIISFLEHNTPKYGNVSWLEDYFYMLE